MTNKKDSLDVVLTKLDYVQRDVSEIKQKLEKDYVTQDEFEPIKKIVYGMVSVILMTVLAALIALVVRQI